MANNQIDIPPKGGFSFDLCKRNEMLIKKGVEVPKFRKIGTTIVGFVFKVISQVTHMNAPIFKTPKMVVIS